MNSLRFVTIFTLLLISQAQDSELIINDVMTDVNSEKENLVENTKSELPELEIISPKESPSSPIWRSLLMTFPVLLYTINQLWGFFSPNIVSKFSKQFKNQYATYFSNAVVTQNGKRAESVAVQPTDKSDEHLEKTDDSNIDVASSNNIIKTMNAEVTPISESNQFVSAFKDLIFIERDNHQVAFYEGYNRILGYLFDIECLNRQDVFFCAWNKVHDNTDNIEITAFIKTDEQFSMYFGRKSYFGKIEALTDIKSVCCENQSLISKNLPKYMICLAECHNLVNILPNKFFETVGKNIGIFNYLCITDISQTKLESETFQKLDSRGLVVKISLALTYQQLWGYEFNRLHDFVKEFCSLVKTISILSLPKESKALIKKSRQQLADQKIKEEHSKRQELAMKKKDEKVRALKDKMMAETDNEKQIKLKEKFDRLEAKEKIKKSSKGKCVMVVS